MLCSALVTDTIGMFIEQPIMFDARVFYHRYPCDLRCALFCIDKLTAQPRPSREGSFLAGLIVPREGGLTVAFAEKLQDMVSIIFLPLVTTLVYLCYIGTYM